MLTFFLAWRLPLGAQLLEGDSLYAAAEAELFDMKRMTVANSNLGAGNERETAGLLADGFQGWVEG